MYNQKRYEVGIALYDALKNDERILLPKIIEGATPVFNHLPVVFKEHTFREKVQQRLWERGIDTARMYQRPIHHIYDLGYSQTPDPFPNATYIAERLVTLPTHPFVDDRTLDKIIDAFQAT